jgi:hypothetical protein
VIDLELRYNVDSIPAMAEQRRRVFESVTQGVQNGILTRNEAREQLGYEPLNGADSLLVPANLMPLNIAGDEDSPKDEPDTNPMEEEQVEQEAQEEEQEQVQIENDMESADEELDEIIKAES